MKSLIAPLLLTLGLSAPFLAQAHDAWILPSSTVLSGDEAWVTVDAAVGNDKFYFDHRPMALNGLQIKDPAGKDIAAQNAFSGAVRSGFDIHLTTDGTYRIAVVNHGAMATWKEDGKPRRWFGPLENLADKVPARAEGLQVQERLSRVETFVTKGKPSQLDRIDRGLALTPAAHPNDLVAGEKTGFTLTLDGKPLPDAEIEIVPEGSRYRDQLNAITAKTDDKGSIQVTWPAAGRYWLHAQASDTVTSVAQADKRTLSYSATLEVLPQ